MVFTVIKPNMKVRWTGLEMSNPMMIWAEQELNVDQIYTTIEHWDKDWIFLKENRYGWPKDIFKPNGIPIYKELVTVKLP